MWRPSQSGALELSDATTVAWLEQSEADLPPHDDWLSVDEALQLDRLRFAKRRADWRLGRWTAKPRLELLFVACVTGTASPVCIRTIPAISHPAIFHQRGI